MTTLHKAAREALEALEALLPKLTRRPSSSLKEADARIAALDALATLRAALSEAPGEEREAAWFSLVMNAAAELEDAANCLRDTDAERKARNASKHYRDTANIIYAYATRTTGKEGGA